MKKLTAISKRFLTIMRNWNLDQKKAVIGMLEKAALGGTLGFVSQIYGKSIDFHDIMWLIAFLLLSILIAGFSVWLLKTRDNNAEE